MNLLDRLRTVDASLDARLRAAANALREGSGTQVDAGTGLREILHTNRAAADPPQEPTGATAPHRSLAASGLRSPQRVALAVNLLLVLVLGALIVRVATFDREPAGTTPITASTAVATTAVASTAVASTAVASTVVASPPKVVTRAPQACVDAADLADEVISRLDRHLRDQRLFSALRDYTIASQACRRAASP
jgi:hypothetical protein